jgi:NAD(P)-dependent dehydrogenase (short-subunit alcohol dehydrogenase family)
LDVTNSEQIQAAVQKVESLDVLINNAGIALYDDLSNVDAIGRHLAVNLFGMLNVTRAFLPLLKRSRGPLLTTYPWWRSLDCQSYPHTPFRRQPRLT